MPMAVGYARVSTQEQDLALQLDTLQGKGCARIYTEKASGAQRDRPQLQAALDYMRPDDTLVVWKLDRLARSLRQLLGHGRSAAQPPDRLRARRIRPLRIIHSTPKPATMSPLHHHLRGHCHVPTLFFYQLGLVVLVCVFLMLCWLWPNDAASPHQPIVPTTPSRRQRSKEPQLFAGLTQRPPCALCAREATQAHEPPPAPPEPMPRRTAGHAP